MVPIILLCGIPSELSLKLVVDELDKMGVSHLVFNQRMFYSSNISYKISKNRVTGVLKYLNNVYPLEDFTAVYSRLMNFQELPELRNEPVHSDKRKFCFSFHNTLVRWMEIAPILVVNKLVPTGTNFSKPYQAQIILKHGFNIPETLITNDPTQVMRFKETHGKIIYKSISAFRSVVQTLEDADIERLDLIQWCPIQFQEFIEGVNVRVHTVGDEVFPTVIESQSTDYRYSYLDNEHESLSEYVLPSGMAEQCIRLADAIGLKISGIDLKITPEGKVYCFEVNPSPAFSYYEMHTGQRIANSIARFLAETVDR